ncbi:YjbH domain-containing protein [Limnobacter humi]|uniref:YjbH domain-containing protein n=1 Tax=Limnobacter humi TaxID=1778671 RepID=A0ABT1WLH4_9BURK|nr:YjbH domain-containing protein [Limnobacter humi]MCQ8897744.1 YjbH domain-containing protein [Limnobacter humi]
MSNFPRHRLSSTQPRLLILLFGALWAGHAQADDAAAPVGSASEPAVSTPFNIQAGERLSVFLRRNQWVPGLAEIKGVYLPATLLNRQALVQAQALQKTQLITNLTLASAPPALLQWVHGLPVTGRLVLKSVDADELALKPNWDPRLQPGDAVQTMAPTRVVGVVSSRGYCAVAYQPGVEATQYVQACQADQAVDQVWLVQPTGQVVPLSVGLWNARQQTVPMPGAWVLAVPRTGTVNAPLAQQVAEFMATQGQAPAVGGVRALSAQAQTVSPLRDLPISSSTWGWVGLLQTPTARMRPAGSASITASRVEPYSRYSFILQPFDWLEGGFRYTKITNRLFGPQDFSGNQKYLDKNIDIKLRLMEETADLPQVAVGLNDIGGTALFSSEYLVANKRFGDFDTSLGLAWGYLGSSGILRNPLGLLANQFDTRPAPNVGQGGQLGTTSFFRGRVAPFGGVQWHTPWDNFTVKLEYDGNDYKNEPLANPQTQNSRFNYGVVYKASNSVNWHVGVERGNTLSVAISLFENLSTFSTAKLSDPKPLAVTTTPRPNTVDWKQTLQTLQQQTDLNVNKVEQRGSEVKLNVRNGRAAYYNQTVERASEVLHQDLPANIKWFTLDYERNGVDMGQHVVDRNKFVARRTEYALETANGEQPDQTAVEGYHLPYKTLYEKPNERFKNTFSLGYRQILGGADGYLYQFSLANDTRLNFTDSTWLDARLSYRLVDNFAKFKQVGASALPQVRTNLREYAITSNFTIPNFTLKHMGSLGNGHFYGLYGGLLEDMFAGAGAEYLYRPFGSPLAVGVDVNRVRQRAFEQNFKLQPYQVNTGNVTAYWDTGYEGLFATVSAGQYLAGDKGVTVDLSREFNNGVRMGAFATRTNVSAADFGEGSFDKGIYVTIPFGAFFTKSIPGNANFLWRPITRDGGAKLERGFSLYSETSVRSPKTFSYRE